MKNSSHSPFPGMDPYLEGDLWTGFHALFATQIVRDLNRKLGPAYVAMAAPFSLDTVMPESVPHTWVKILEVAKKKLVTAIEFLSPTNKRGQERRNYLRKRQRFLVSSVHLLEIDLLRKGKRVPMQEPLPGAGYFVLLSRARHRPLTEVWPITLDQPLPTVPVPLLPKDDDVPLDLQQVFTADYAEGRYRSLIDYFEPADVPLPEEALGWLRRRLKAEGD